MSKVNFFVGGFPVLSETFVINQVAAILESGIDTKVISMFPGIAGEGHPAVKKHDLLNKRLLAYSGIDKKSRIKDIIKAITTDVTSLKWNRLIWLMRAGHDGYMLGREFESIQGLVICHFGPMGADLAVLKNKGVIKDIDIITVFHGFDMSAYSLLEEYKERYELLFDEGKWMLPVSDFWKERLITLGCSRDKILTQRMGVNSESFIYQERYSQRTFDNNEINLICVCRFVEKKGVPVLLKALSVLPEKYKLTLVGNGELQSEVEQEVQALEIGTRVDMTGSLSSDQVAQRLSTSDAFVLPSVTARDGDMEGVPVALMEAMAQGLLVFSTYHSGIPELIEHGSTGFLAEEKDHIELANNIRYAFEELAPEARQSIAEQAKCKVANEFNLNKLNSELVELISNS
ncbi:glycosyltransferase [Vibrio sp. TRT 17S01]|uniref:glycosyltransferase n=1 Tax=Vibrio sp. TRT 17S01 TaxID=3418505 RepID=UPI003CFB562C